MLGLLREGELGGVMVEDRAGSWEGTGRGKTGTEAWRRGAKSQSEQPLPGPGSGEDLHREPFRGHPGSSPGRVLSMVPE